MWVHGRHGVGHSVAIVRHWEGHARMLLSHVKVSRCLVIVLVVVGVPAARIVAWMEVVLFVLWLILVVLVNGGSLALAETLSLPTTSALTRRRSN